PTSIPPTGGRGSPPAGSSERSAHAKASQPWKRPRRNRSTVLSTSERASRSKRSPPDRNRGRMGGYGFFSVDRSSKRLPIKANLLPKHDTPSGSSRSGPLSDVSFGASFGSLSPSRASDRRGVPSAARKTSK